MLCLSLFSFRPTKVVFIFQSTKHLEDMLKNDAENRCQKQCRGGVPFDIASIHILRVGRIAVMDLMLDVFLCGDESGLGKLLVVA